ncbi:hypothetical protein LZD49_01595 [Dyadobacter sp. CY261]|uniref:hypothetical protein n=1 Tax=Dyadobacter sp. CY261 TaxID=2907203 RepID=UPI001F24093A|nr:hypothetical protein [Dyadobacter sp. CY261]MCF0069145.1 hypothetical protein [Dyadobacter sp. CY261]
MKRLKANLAAICLGTGILLASCGTANDQETTVEGSGSTSETTPNDSSGAESRKDIGVGEDNQKDSLGYPSNQSNLNADSTSRKHDDEVGKPARNE